METPTPTPVGNPDENSEFINIPQPMDIQDISQISIVPDNASTISQGKPQEGENKLEKIANMSKFLTDEANALKNSIKSLSQDIERTKKDLIGKSDDPNFFPYHLLLLEIIINRLSINCGCFDENYNNLLIVAKFLDNRTITLFDTANGVIHNNNKINLGKSTLFALTNDRICSIKEFVILIELMKKPSCNHQSGKLAHTRINLTEQFENLKKVMCEKWKETKDDAVYTDSTAPVNNKYTLVAENNDFIGLIETTIKISFLGKEVTKVFAPERNSNPVHSNRSVIMCSSQKIEMDDNGQIYLDERVLTEVPIMNNMQCVPQLSTNMRAEMTCDPANMQMVSRIGNEFENMLPKTDVDNQRYNEIYTNMNNNELTIRVPKTTKADKYDRISEMCTCEETPYNTGDQIQFQLPKDLTYPGQNNMFSSDLKYTYNAVPNNRNFDKNRKVVNVTPTNCPIPINMEKMLHPRKDVFVLKIGKKLESKDKKTELEIELVTPKSPSDIASGSKDASQQYSKNDIKGSSSKSKLKAKKSNKKINSKSRSKSPKSKKKK